jgi:hypothetical protein
VRGLFKWLYRLPGRLVSSFGPTLAATGVESCGIYGGPEVNQTGVGIVTREIEKSTHLDEADDQNE